MANAIKQHFLLSVKQRAVTLEEHFNRRHATKPVERFAINKNTSLDIWKTNIYLNRKKRLTVHLLIIIN